MTGWAGLFKRSPKLKADPGIRWFGKLPSYADYYRGPQTRRSAFGGSGSSGDEEWAVEFNDWVLRGFEIYHTWLVKSALARPEASTTTQALRRLPISGCILRLPKSGMTVLGSIQDYGGDMRGRPFPLCFYAGLPTAQWPGPSSDRLPPAIAAVEKLNALSKEVVRFFKVPGPFESVFGGRELDLDTLTLPTDDGWQIPARALSMSRWFEGAASAIPAVSLPEWLGRMRGWGERIRAMDSEASEPTLALPLSSRAPVEIQAAGWLRWLESRMDLQRRCLSLLWTGQSQQVPARLMIIARELVPDDFLLLSPAAGTLTYVDSPGEVPCNAGRGGPDAVAPAGVPVSLSWADFVLS